MRGAQEAHMRIVSPAPAREEHRRQQALGEAWRHVYEQPVDLTVIDGLKVIADGLHVPAPDKLVSRLNDRPSLMDELAQFTLASPPTPPQVQFCRYWGQLQQLFPRQS